MRRGPLERSSLDETSLPTALESANGGRVSPGLMAAEWLKDFWKLEFAAKIGSLMAGGTFFRKWSTTPDSSVASVMVW